MVPLNAIASFTQAATAATVNHQGTEVAATVSFDLAPGKSLSDAKTVIDQAEAQIALPSTVHGAFAGTALQAQQSQGSQPLLILAALVTIYIVLGILYESLIHPLTVLSTLPAASVGAVLALMIMGMDFSIIALIAVFLLLGIVKKNAILIIDFAIHAQRDRGLTAEQAAREASLLRFRPILMTTLAAALGALPLAIGFGEGAELRQPLGVAIIGGLIASQLLTLITTPVVYVSLDNLAQRRRRRRERRAARRSQQRRPTGASRMTLIPSALHRLAALTSVVALAGCSLAPHYQRPNLGSAAATTPTTWKTAPGWTVATPLDDAPRADWWTGFADPALNDLIARAVLHNQTLAQAAATYREARAATREARANLFPTIAANGNVTHTYSGGSTAVVTGGSISGGTTTTGTTGTGPPAPAPRVRRRPARPRAPSPAAAARPPTTAST